MKKFILFTFIIILILSCDTVNIPVDGTNTAPEKDGTNTVPGSDDGKLENTNIYLLGTDAYYKNGQKYNLTIPQGYNEVSVYKIIVSNGKVFVIGSFSLPSDGGGSYTQACYWQDGEFNVFSVDNTIRVYHGDVFVSNGQIYAMSFEGYWWVGTKQYKLPGETLLVFDLYVYNNTVYMVGYNYDNNKMTACYWMNNNKFDLPDQYQYGSANSIFVDEHNIYCCGDSAGIIFYWINGTSFKINPPSGSNYVHADNIIVSAGKIFILASITGDTLCYWENGVLKSSFSRNFLSAKPMVYNGKIYRLYDSSYFINDEEFPIELSSGYYSTAKSIFVYNDDVYITGIYHDDEKVAGCYWINGQRIDVDYPLYGIFIEPK